MSSWAGDGLMAGYDSATRQLQNGKYRFSAPGTVDAQAITRFGIDAAKTPALSASYPQYLNVTAPITLTEADFTYGAYPGRPALSAALYIVHSGFFPDGYVPKPSEIIALGDSKVNVYRAKIYCTVAGTYTFNFWEISGQNFTLNTKWWVMVVPTWLTSLGDVPPSISVDRPALNIDVDTMCRAISFWTDRTPNAPTITSSPSASVNPGGSYTLTFASGDPDALSPNDAQRANVDVQGIYAQYAAQPTPTNPNPEWRDLPFKINDSPYIDFSTRFILNETVVNGPYYLIDNMAIPIHCGGSEFDTPVGSGYLPGGDWQVRLRTADYGNPYPLVARDPSLRYDSSWDGWPEAFKSPWSTPIKISVPSQVPPPTPTYPTNDLAVLENQTVRLAWQYRNTFTPPKAQFKKVVQIRKVGDSTWTTVCNTADANPYFDLPVNFVAPANPAAEYLTNGNFEAANVDGWFAGDGGDHTPGTLTRITASSPGPRSGVGYLKSAATQHSVLVPNPPFPYYVNYGMYGIARRTVPNPAHDQFSFSAYVYVPTISIDATLIVLNAWVEADGQTSVYDPAHPEWAYLKTISLPAGTQAGYIPINLGPIARPGAGAYFVVNCYVTPDVWDNSVSPFPNYDIYMDDASIYGAVTYTLGDFALEATTEYEWRVLVQDTDGVSSSFSSPARFWVVPEQNDADSKPVPVNTLKGATLGCGTHTVEIYRRGGKRRVATLKGVSYVDWGRVRDDFSTAKVVVRGWDDDCGELLASLRTWAHEIVLWRDNGYTKERVWEGPITLLTYEEDAVTLEAKDVVGYLYRRIIKRAMNDSANGAYVTARAAQVIRDVFAPDDPNILEHLQVLSRDDDAVAYRSTPAYARTAYEEIDEMAAKSGLDYTAVGRSILLWGTKHRIGTLIEFTDKYLGAAPIISEYGMQMANRYAVTDGNGIYGEATRLDVSGNDPDYGLVEMLASTWSSDTPSDSGTYTQAGIQTMIESFEGYAERGISDRYPAPVVVRVPDNTTVNPDTPISIQQLVPGVVIPLRATGTLRSVVASQKLDSVKVVDTDGKETITVTMSPFSTDDAVDTQDTVQ